MNKRKKILGAVVISLILIGFVFAKSNRISPLFLGHDEVSTPMFSDLALEGHDPVAYFTEEKAVLGSSSHEFEWRNAKWHFSSEANKSAFMAEPEKYAPQFGGYCAFAVSKGFTAKAEINCFEMVEDRLFLFNAEEVRNQWKDKIDENLLLARENWK